MLKIKDYLIVPERIQRLFETSLNFFIRDLKSRYADSLLGGLWVVLYPFSLTLITTLVFSYIFRNLTEGKPYFLIVLIGWISWNFFASSIGRVARSLVANRSLIANAEFPRESIILSIVFSSLVDYLVNMIIVIIIVSWQMSMVGAIIVFKLLLIATVQLILQIGIGLAVASANVYYRDVSNIVDIGLRLMFYLTPVFYPVSVIQEKYQFVFKYNFMHHIIKLNRTLLLEMKIDWDLFFGLLAVALFSLSLGWFVFKKLRGGLADLI
jgi:ABC-type polysaccharide/polyol phosphate export permease